MSDELDGLLRASVRSEAPDWLEQLVTERAVASVQSEVKNEAPSFGAASRRLRDGVVRFARDVRRRARRASALWARVRAATPRPRAPDPCAGHDMLLDVATDGAPHARAARLRRGMTAAGQP
jgi:hypothetical protein